MALTAFRRVPKAENMMRKKEGMVGEAVSNPDPLRVNPAHCHAKALATVGKPLELFNTARALDSTRSPDLAAMRTLFPEVVQEVGCLTIGEVAARLRVSRATVYRMIDRGELEHFRVGTSIRVAGSAVEQLVRGGPKSTSGCLTYPVAVHFLRGLPRHHHHRTRQAQRQTVRSRTAHHRL